ncbi:MAG: FliA/WhiG family RNA polymerase sigma factor [Lachnospiraceae bacterium]|nr:FliA/WhiG family RNA polymerase sigma factor [Lachnospiraceae bacterium]
MDEAKRKKLWDEYSRSRSAELREQIILEYAPLVKLVAGRLSMYLGYNVEYDDLVGYGIFGLIDAIDKFDSAKDVKFETYASLRIRGAILDQIRKMDWIPRTVRQKQKRIETAIKEIESASGRNATDEEVAASLGISEDEYSEWQQQLLVTNVVSLNEFTDQGTEAPIDRSVRQRFDTPEEVTLKAEMKEKLVEALEVLTEKEKKVVLLYYYEELTLKEISNVLEVSESRVSQLHSKALAKMKKKLGKYMGLLGA